MQAPIRQTGMQYNGVRPTDYTKGKHDLYALRYDDPSRYAKEQQGNVRFWMNFHADQYDSVILSKSHPTTNMKSINWEYLLDIDLPVVREVGDACRRMNLTSIVSFNCDWNEEVVAQLYGALYINRSTKTFHWTIQGKPFSFGYVDFATILGFPSNDLTREKIQEMENMLDDREFHFMYDSAYGDIKFGTIHGLTPSATLCVPKVVIRTTSRTCPRICLQGWLPIKMSLVCLPRGDHHLFSFTQEGLSLCTIYLCHDQRGHRGGNLDRQGTSSVQAKERSTSASPQTWSSCI
jgi:hypothetical protein